MAALGKGVPGENYFICGPTHTLIEGMKMVEQISGIPAPKFTAPPALLKGMAVMMGVIEPFVTLPPNLHRRVSACQHRRYLYRQERQSASGLGLHPAPAERRLA